MRIFLKEIIKADERYMKDIAKEIGISRQCLYHFINGKYKNPERATLIKIVKFIYRYGHEKENLVE
jgi:predicted transcriptional regulator